MPRETHKQELAERQDPAAPYLFDEHQLPLRPDIVRAVVEQRYVHKGVRLLEDEEKALRMVELLLMGWGLKKIAREMSVSKHTVRAAREALVVQGKLAPYKQRVLAKLEEAIELGLDHYITGVEDGKVSPAQTPMPTGIFWDKRALALSEPTAIVGSAGDQGEPKALSIENLNAWVENLKSATPIDSTSTENHEKPRE